MDVADGSLIDKKLLIEGLGKGLRILECFNEETFRLTATEAGERAGLTRTAARRYLLSLVHYGYAGTDGKHYWLLPKVLRLGHGYIQSNRLSRLVQPFLQRFSGETGETANFSVLDGHEVVYLFRSNSPRVLSIGFHTGARMVAHCSSAGYAMLSQWPDADLEVWIEEHEFIKLNHLTLTGKNDFRLQVQACRASGYAYVDQYANVGLSGIAVPLMDGKGKCVGALSTTFQNLVYPGDEFRRVLLPRLQATAEALRSLV